MAARRPRPAATLAFPRPRPPLIAAIPARNEAADLPACLRALAGQQGRGFDAVVVCLNNCTDASAAVVRQLAADLPFALVAPEVMLPPERACAGEARRIAMDLAADIAGPGGILFATDADGRVAPDWLAANLSALQTGADAVAGVADIDPIGAALIPAHLHEADARECAYAALLDEIDALLDPNPIDPWPRHSEHSGASIAVTVAAYRRAGGIPPLLLAEDRGFFAALRRVDAAIRHEPAARVEVSARIVGRAAGGMADTIRRRLVALDDTIDDRLEPVMDAARRSTLRARLRAEWRIDHARSHTGYFGTAWAELEASSPELVRHRVPVADLPAQTALAITLRDSLRAVRPAADRDGMPARAAVA